MQASSQPTNPLTRCRQSTAEYTDEDGRRVYLSGAAAETAEMPLADEAQASESASTAPSGSMTKRRTSDA